MIPILFNETATDFTTFGIGVLRECTSCEVTEERNGSPFTGAFAGYSAGACRDKGQGDKPYRAH